MPNYLLVDLSSITEFWHESHEYCDATCGARLLLSGPSQRVRDDTWRQLAGLDRNGRWGTPTAEISGGYGRVDTSFLANITHCTGLPNGCDTVGKYMPAVYFLRQSRVEIISTTEFACPHCAYMMAKELIEGSGIVMYPVGIVSPSVWFVGDRSDRDFETPFFAEGGRVNLSSSTTKIEYNERGCSTCGLPGHNSRTCDRKRRRYDKVGIEIEGRYINKPEIDAQARADGLGTEPDGSIRASCNEEVLPLEIQTRPGLVVEALRQLAKYYPDEADSSCGMHVHVSFLDPADISALTCPEFYAFFEMRWRAWGEKMQLRPTSQFFKRLNGDNDYCLKNEGEDFDNAFRSRMDRYRQLNFTAWEEHKTVECRLLPMFSEARIGLAAVVELVHIYEDWLNGACDNVLPSRPFTTGREQAGIWAQASAPLTLQSELEVEFRDKFLSFASEIEIADLPPIPENYARIAMTPSQLLTLAGLGARAA